MSLRITTLFRKAGQNSAGDVRVDIDAIDGYGHICAAISSLPIFALSIFAISYRPINDEEKSHGGKTADSAEDLQTDTLYVWGNGIAYADRANKSRVAFCDGRY